MGIRFTNHRGRVPSCEAGATSLTTILAVVGDLHVNSTVGLCRYSHNLDDGGTYRSSKGQRWLWRNWLSFWDEVQTQSNEMEAEVWTVFNGDLVSVKVKHESTQFNSMNMANVFPMAIDTIQPALDRSDRTFVVRGTAAHVGLSGEKEEEIARDIGAEKCGDNYSWWELLLECEGVQFDIRHHGPLGRMEHTMGNALNRRAKEMEDLYWSQQRKCPDVAIQSHNHRFATSSDQYAVKVYALPAWELKTEFVHRIGVIKPADIGGMYFICEGGEYQPVVKRYKPETARAWKPSPIKT